MVQKPVQAQSGQTPSLRQDCFRDEGLYDTQEPLQAASIAHTVEKAFHKQKHYAQVSCLWRYPSHKGAQFAYFREGAYMGAQCRILLMDLARFGLGCKDVWVMCNCISSPNRKSKVGAVLFHREGSWAGRLDSGWAGGQAENVCTFWR